MRPGLQRMYAFSEAAETLLLFGFVPPVQVTPRDSCRLNSVAQCCRGVVMGLVLGGNSILRAVPA